LRALAYSFGDELPLHTAELTIEFDDEESVAAWLRKRLSETHMAEAHRKGLEKQHLA